MNDNNIEGNKTENLISPFKAYQNIINAEYDEKLFEENFNIIINSNDYPVITVWALDIGYRVEDCIRKILKVMDEGGEEYIECAVRWLLDSYGSKWDAYKYNNTMMSAMLNNKAQVLDNYYYIFRFLMWKENNVSNSIVYPSHIDVEKIIELKKRILKLGTFEDLKNYLVKFSEYKFNYNGNNWDELRKEFYADLPAEYHVGVLI